MIALILAGALSSQTDTQFDLHCVGQQIFDDVAIPYETTIGIDLEAGRWCIDGCREGRQIVSVTPELITLIDRPSREAHGVRMASGAMIDRSKLTYSAFYRFVGAGIETGGAEMTCQVAAFSGIPAGHP